MLFLLIPKQRMCALSVAIEKRDLFRFALFPKEKRWTANSGITLFFVGRERSKMDIISKKCGLSAAQLKGIAVTSMLFDHGVKILWRDAPLLLYAFGRVAFPIYAFLLAEGARHTRSMGRYALRLGIFAVISEIPFDLCFFHTIWEVNAQNVFFTLLLGLLCIWAISGARSGKSAYFRIFLVVVLALLADFFKADYGRVGVFCILLMNAAIKAHTAWLKLILCTVGILCTARNVVFLGGRPLQLFALLALAPIMMYNGKKGRQGHQWLWYAFYPGHLLLLWLLS